MDSESGLEIAALVTLLRETLLRAGDRAAYLLNPGDPGLVETLRQSPAAFASRAPGPDRKPIVAHASHVLYGIELANRALDGEPGVYATADWEQSWTLISVDEAQWQQLIARLEAATLRLIEQVQQPRNWDEITLTGAFSIAAHAAYHLGAIRQMSRQLEEQA